MSVRTETVSEQIHHCDGCDKRPTEVRGGFTRMPSVVVAGVNTSFDICAECVPKLYAEKFAGGALPYQT